MGTIKESDEAIWRHIAQEQYAKVWRLRGYNQYPVEGALDALFNSYKKTGKFTASFCSQCGAEFGPNYHGYSHCENHPYEAQR